MKRNLMKMKTMIIMKTMMKMMKMMLEVKFLNLNILDNQRTKNHNNLNQREDQKLEKIHLNKVLNSQLVFNFRRRNKILKYN